MAWVWCGAILCNFIKSKLQIAPHCAFTSFCWQLRCSHAIQAAS